MVWKLTPSRGTSSTLFGSGGAVVNLENWKCAHMLHSHTGDVLDLAWSPDDSFLATGSIDNTICIWDAGNLPSLVHVIRGHKGLVKGVVFDPVGVYLASQSDDKSVCVWRIKDWKLESCIEQPFEEASGTTHVLRL